MTAARPDAAGGVLAVNTGVARDVEWAGRRWRTAIFKAPVIGPAWVGHDGVDGDEQANTRVHGGPDKAVYAYGRADLDWWQPRLGHALAPGAFGENLTLAGVDPAGALVGERWRVGEALLEVAGPRIPCAKLGLRHEDAGLPRRFARAGRPGAYLRVVERGRVAARDRVVVAWRPVHGVTVGLVHRVYHREPALAARLLGAPELPDSWRAWARERVAAGR